ncbi:GAF domain-containing sensor histidine kinase [Bacillus sp. CGMCC 1.16607]|uniref:GAF domain-containing sensor histidine kinase n=1 Tax=Bacillus sp. CGMCC 1.16607 TaxID=3351842 RepID=UPI003644C066
MEDRTHHSELLVLKEIAELLNKETEIYGMLSGVLQKLLQVTGMDSGWIFLVDEKGSFELAAHENLPPALNYQDCAPMCKGGCWCLDRYNDGRLEKATNIIACKRIEDAILHNWGDTLGITHHASVPLRAGKEKFGILNVGSPNKTFFHPDELALLESIAYQIGTALKRIKLIQKEQEMALTAERNRLARDLHDSVNQILFSLSLTARGGREMTEHEEVKETFSYIQDLAQEALTEMRALIWQLRPQGLENGVVSALSSYGNMLGLKVKTNVKGLICLPGRVEETVWRIGQEALANCKKHSQQGEVDIQLIVQKHHFNMTIEDFGCGFNYDQNQELPSLGLKSMKERTEAMNGTFELQSYPGKGTKLLVRIPI